ncbi:unnamed protein product, partial [Discosporangium mesarthrocarpum]
GAGAPELPCVEAELAEITKLHSQLRGELAGKEASWKGEREALVERARDAEASALATSIKSLKEDIKARPTVQEARALRRQVRVLQQLEFNAGADEVHYYCQGGDDIVCAGLDEEPQGHDPEDTAGHAERTMEQVIRNRVRRLEADLTSAQRLVDETRADSERLREDVETLGALAADRMTVIARLEDDLAMALQASGSPPPPSTATVAATATGRGAGAGGGAEKGVEGGGGGVGPSVGGLGGAGLGAGGDMGTRSLSDLLGAQRDRFRSRMKELEAEKAEASREAELQATTLEGLQRDNLQLYEKVRFLQSYQQGKPPPSSRSGNTHLMEEGHGIPSRSSDIGVGAGAGRGRSSPTEARYGQMYEARINPFAQFSQRERQRKYEELSVAEKITFTLTKMFLGNKFARWVLPYLTLQSVKPVSTAMY